MPNVTTLNRNMKFGQLADVKDTKATDAIFVKDGEKIKGVDPIEYLEEKLDPIYLDHDEGATKMFAITMAIVL